MNAAMKCLRKKSMNGFGHYGNAHKILIRTKSYIQSVRCKKHRFAVLQIQNLDAPDLKVLHALSLRITNYELNVKLR